MTPQQLAAYVVDWLRKRNRSQLRPALLAMSVEDYELMHDELAEILKHNGHPPNWVEPPSDTTITLPDGRVLSNHTEELKELGAWQAVARQVGAIDEERSGRKTKPEDVLRLTTTLREWLASERAHTDSLRKALEKRDAIEQGLNATINGLHDALATTQKRARARMKAAKGRSIKPLTRKPTRKTRKPERDDSKAVHDDSEGRARARGDRP